MSDWLGIATAAVGILTLFVKKAGEKVAEKAGEALFALIKAKLKGNDEAESTIKNFENNPKRHGSALVDILKEEAYADPAFGTALKQLVEEAGGHTSKKVTQIAQGTGIAQSAGDKASASVIMGRASQKPEKRKKK